MYAAGSEKEKRAGGPPHWGHYSTPVRILQWGVGGALPGRRVLVWRAPLSHRPTLQRFPGQGDTPCTPGGNQGFPAPSLGRQVRPSLSIAGDTLYPRRGLRPLHPLLGEMRKAPSFHLARPPTLLGTGGLAILPRKHRPLRPAWGRRGTGTLPSLPPSTRAGTEGRLQRPAPACSEHP